MENKARPGERVFTLLLLILGLPVLLAAGYLMGLARCASALWTAFRAGRSP